MKFILKFITILLIFVKVEKGGFYGIFRRVGVLEPRAAGGVQLGQLDIILTM